jgi:hypothetical protein
MVKTHAERSVEAIDPPHHSVRRAHLSAHSAHLKASVDLLSHK